MRPEQKDCQHELECIKPESGKSPCRPSRGRKRRGRKPWRPLPPRDHAQEDLHWTGFEGYDWTNEWLREQRGPMQMTLLAEAEWTRPSKADMDKAFKEAPVGKQLPDSLYVHVTAVDTLPELLYRQLNRAVDIAGEAVEYDLVKINKNGLVVSLLSYPTFMDDSHPALARTVAVNLETGSVRDQDYSQRQSPPILHRKESFLDPSHPRYNEFAKLTKQEEQHGLLNKPGIGTRGKWEELLVQKNIMIEDHELRTAGNKMKLQASYWGEQQLLDELEGVEQDLDHYDALWEAGKIDESTYYDKVDTLYRDLQEIEIDLRLQQRRAITKGSMMTLKYKGHQYREAMHHESHTREELLQAQRRGEQIWWLDTDTAGGDDLLIGDYDDVLEAILYYHEIEELPSRWSLDLVDWPLEDYI